MGFFMKFYSYPKILFGFILVVSLVLPN